VLHKERVLKALRKEPVDKLPKDLWVDSNNPEVLKKILNELGESSYAALMDRFGIDIIRPKTPVRPEVLQACGDGIVKYFIPTTDEKMLTCGGEFERPLGYIEELTLLNDVDWPSPDIFDYDNLKTLCEAQGHRFVWAQPGTWSPIFIKICDLFGMEKCLMDMLINPDLIVAVTEKLFRFYYEVFERTIIAGRGYIDAVSFGDDYASQLSMMFSTKLWHKYFEDPVRKLCKLIKDNGLLIGFHSCGAMSDLIPSLIDMGVDFLFPVQPKAAGMDASTLKEKYGSRLGFYGGIDVQELLPYGTEEDVRKEVRRVADIMGKGGGYILSSAHSITIDIPVKNVVAMYEEADSIRY
jgi:uroporphyrinogen decarboxylase